jgi:hypothetical protein
MKQTQQTQYRKGTLEARLDDLLPDWPSFDVIAHELWADGDGGFSVNDSWHLGRDCDREEAITHLRHRWEVWKLNYMPKARVADLTDASCDSESPSLLEVNCAAFAEVRKGSR